MSINRPSISAIYITVMAFQCNSCNRSFSRHWNFTRHIQTVHTPLGTVMDDNASVPDELEDDCSPESDTDEERNHQ